jgi:hypothetical protein
MTPQQNNRGAMVTSRCGASRQNVRCAHAFRSKRQTLAFVACAYLVAALAITACVPLPSTPEKAIVGQWVNDQGGTIYFYEDGAGFIPAVQGVAEEMPAVAFKYEFNDDNHVRIDLGEQGGEQRIIVVEIKVAGNKMTWRNPATGTDYTYTRQK